jgi:threonine/homoserine/homoserine lactone efflux protein
MISIVLNGFFTGLLLQIAIGPVFFFILNLSLQKTVVDGLFAVIAVTIVDYLFITLAVLGVGKLLEKPKIELVMGIVSSIVLLLFGILMMMTIQLTSMSTISNAFVESNYISSFLSAFLLTISSPLTIVFWTSLFATKAIAKGYKQKQLVLFGLAAGAATFVFLGFSVALLSTIRASVPVVLLRVLNIAVGSVLVVYAIMRLRKIVKHPVSSSA